MLAQHRTIATILFAVMAVACLPASHAAPCQTKNEASATEIALDLNDQKTLDGLHIGFQLGLLPASFPADDIAKTASPCSRGSFGAGAKNADLFGETDATPPLWAKVAGSDDVIVYFASMPKPEASLRWREAYEKQKKTGGPIEATFQTGDMMIVAAVYTKGSPVREIFGFLSDLPNDELAKAWAAQLLSGGRKPLGYFDTGNRQFAPAK